MIQAVNFYQIANLERVSVSKVNLNSNITMTRVWTLNELPTHSRKVIGKGMGFCVIVETFWQRMIFFFKHSFYFIFRSWIDFRLVQRRNDFLRLTFDAYEKRLDSSRGFFCSETDGSEIDRNNRRTKRFNTNQRWQLALMLAAAAAVHLECNTLQYSLSTNNNRINT